MALKFHILDIVSRDQTILVENDTTREVEFIEGEISDDDDEVKPVYRGKDANYKKPTKRTALLFHVFGTTETGASIRLDVKSFKPFFYIRLPPEGSGDPEDINPRQVVINYLKDNLPKHFIEAGIGVSHTQREVLYEYNGGTLFPFLKITVPSLSCYRNVRKLFLDPATMIPKTVGYVPLFPGGDPKVYEANLDPMLRFLHLQDLAPCGWAQCDTLSLDELEKEGQTLVGECEWSEITPCEAPQSRPCAPFVIASWDIECFSKSGDFTLPRKKFEQVIEKTLDAAVSAANFNELFIEALYGKDSNDIKISLTKTMKRTFVEKQIYSDKFLTVVGEYLKKRGGLKGTAKLAEVAKVGAALDKYFLHLSRPRGDPIIQIGVVLKQLGSTDISTTSRHIFVLGKCSPVEGATVYSFDNDGDAITSEKKLILAFCNFIGDKNPDILTGYNIFGFDERYIWERCLELGLVKGDGWDTEIAEPILKFSRLAENGGSVRLEEKFLSSAALGDNFMYIISMQGRLQIDLFGYIKRNFNLPSYKLDEVTKNFLSGKFTMMNGTIRIRITVGKKMANEVGIGRSIVFLDDLGESLTGKLRVVEVDGEDLILDARMLDEDDHTIVADHAIKWVVVKDDVSAKELFRLHQGSADDRAIIAKYCIQDCDLVLDLFKKLDVFNNAMSMANVCSVPINYIFSRGQGIKCESLIFKFCHKKNQTIEVLPAPANNHFDSLGGNGGISGTDTGTEESNGQAAAAVVEDSSYEGAYVMEPKAGFYTESPIGVCDFASLYPSTIISERFSPDNLVWSRDFAEDGSLITQSFGSGLHDMKEGVQYIDIEFDILRPDPADTRKHPAKIKMGTRVCRYAQEKLGTIPEILSGLLAKRKAVRNLMKTEKDSFRLALLDAEQNAYKITANSLYGQLGSRTFKVRLQDIAASVTAYARKQIGFAKTVIERFYGANSTFKGHNTKAEVIYGDSVVSYTPILIRKNNIINIINISELGSDDNMEWLPCPDSDKEYRIISGTDSWTEKGWTPIQTIIRHKLHPSKKIIRVVTHTGIVDVTDDHSLIRKNGVAASTKDLQIGDELLHHPYPSPMTGDISDSFFNDADGSQTNSQTDAAKLAFLRDSAGYNVSIDIHPDEPNTYTVTCNIADSILKENNNAIKKMYELPTEIVTANSLCEPRDEYVYDLTTSNHHFQAGIGKLIVHNTDSLFINFNRKTVAETIAMTEVAGKFVSSALKPPHDFEFDKVYWPFLIFSKKRYVGNKYEEDDSHFDLAYMGVALKRRDYAPIVKTFYKGVIKLLMDTSSSTSIQKAIDFVKECAMKLVEGKYGLGQLIISKSLGAKYSNPPAHKILADRIAARNPGSAPASGDRIDFIYIEKQVGQLSAKSQGERIETPEYLREHKLLPDYLFYIEHQIANPICQIFGLLLESFPELQGQILPSKTDKHDIDKREKIAYQLLFGKALQVYSKQRVRDFGSLFGKVSIPSSSLPSLPSLKTSISTASLQPSKKQVKLDSFFADTAVVKKADVIKRADVAEKKKLSKNKSINKDKDTDGAK